MSELRVNREAVSHIVVRKEKDLPGGYGAPYIWLEEKTVRCCFFWKKTYKAAFYKGGKYSTDEGWRPAYFTKEEVEDDKSWYVVDNQVWSKAYVIIYAGEKQITTVYFDNYKDAIAHCEEAFPNLNYIVQ